MRRLPPRSTRPYTRFPYTTLFRSHRRRRAAPRYHRARPCDRGAQGARLAAGERIDLARPPAVSPTRCRIARGAARAKARSEEHTYELQSLMRISYAVFCMKKKKHNNRTTHIKL